MMFSLYPLGGLIKAKVTKNGGNAVANPPFLSVIRMTFMLLRVLRTNRRACRFQSFHLR